MAETAVKRRKFSQGYQALELVGHRRDVVGARPGASRAATIQLVGHARKEGAHGQREDHPTKGQPWITPLVIEQKNSSPTKHMLMK